MEAYVVPRHPDEHGSKFGFAGTGNTRTPVDILSVLRNGSVLERRCDPVHELWTNWTASGGIESGGHGH